MKVVSSGPPATPRGRNRHVRAYVRVILTIAAGVVTMFPILFDRITYALYLHYRIRPSIYKTSGRGAEMENLIPFDPIQPIYAAFYEYVSAVITSAPILAVFVGGFVLVIAIEVRKRRSAKETPEERLFVGTRR